MTWAMPSQALDSSPGSEAAGVFEMGSFLVGAFFEAAPRPDAARVAVDRERVAVPLVRDVPLVLVAMGLR